MAANYTGIRETELLKADAPLADVALCSARSNPDRITPE